MAETAGGQLELWEHAQNVLTSMQGIAAELELLRSDGHEVASEARSYQVLSEPQAMRATQLFRTVPHEVGHYVYHQARLDNSGATFADLSEAFQDNPYFRWCEELFADLVAPAVARLLTCQRVLVVPDGPLHFLPFGGWPVMRELR